MVKEELRERWPNFTANWMAILGTFHGMEFVWPAECLGSCISATSYSQACLGTKDGKDCRPVDGLLEGPQIWTSYQGEPSVCELLMNLRQNYMSSRIQGVRASCPRDLKRRIQMLEKLEVLRVDGRRYHRSGQILEGLICVCAHVLMSICVEIS